MNIDHIISIYIFYSVLWGLFSAVFYGAGHADVTIERTIWVFLLNTIFMPIGLMIGLFKFARAIWNV